MNFVSSFKMTVMAALLKYINYSLTQIQEISYLTNYSLWFLHVYILLLLYFKVLIKWILKCHKGHQVKQLIITVQIWIETGSHKFIEIVFSTLYFKEDSHHLLKIKYWTSWYYNTHLKTRRCQYNTTYNHYL